MAIHRTTSSSSRHGAATATATTARRASLNGMTVTTLDLGQLGRLLQQTLPKLSMDRDLVAMAQREYSAIIEARMQQKGDNTHASVGNAIESTCRNELTNCATLLSSFLSSTQTTQLPGIVIFEAHSCIGCIQETLQQYKLASQSYIKAIWIASSSSRVMNDGEVVPTERLALTLHRLGRVYGLKGRYKEANDLLKQALLKYEVHLPHIHRDNRAVVIDARNLILYHEQRIRQIDEALLVKKRWNTGTGSTRSRYRQTSLSLIQEESSMTSNNPPTNRRSSV